MTGTEDYYQARAPEYDRVYAKPERQADLALIREWLVNILRGRRVLEIAAGTGYWTEVYAGHAASAVATDVNPATLAVARARIPETAPVRFEVADAFDLTPIAGEFDAAFVGFFWSHLPLASIDAFLTGLFRRLPTGALAVFLDNRNVRGSNSPVTRSDADGNTYQFRSLEDGSEWEVIKNFPTADFVVDTLGAHATDVTVERWTYYWAAACVRR
jgi:ubiquinone/menaquinone biosynthesis C-methylase UbiE